MRILRILEYVGSEKFIRNSLESRGVKGQHHVMDGVIREGFVGDIPLLGLSKFDEDRESRILEKPGFPLDANRKLTEE